MKATKPNGDLIPLEDCYIFTPYRTIIMKVLPELSDSKSAAYNDEPIIGRSFPLKTYSHSENRAISWTAHFIVCKEGDQEDNMEDLRAIEACVYPKDELTGGAPYAPPPICKLKCGELLSRDGELCAVLKSYSVKFPSDTAWDEIGYIPYKFDVDMIWEIVYDSTDLPGSERIFRSGR